MSLLILCALAACLAPKLAQPPPWLTVIPEGANGIQGGYHVNRVLVGGPHVDGAREGRQPLVLSRVFISVWDEEGDRHGDALQIYSPFGVDPPATFLTDSVFIAHNAQALFIRGGGTVRFTAFRCVWRSDSHKIQLCSRMEGEAVDCVFSAPQIVLKLTDVPGVGEGFDGSPFRFRRCRFSTRPHGEINGDDENDWISVPWEEIEVYFEDCVFEDEL